MATGTDSQATTPFPGRIDRRLSLVFAVLFVLVLVVGATSLYLLGGLLIRSQQIAAESEQVHLVERMHRILQDLLFAVQEARRRGDPPPDALVRGHLAELESALDLYGRAGGPAEKAAEIREIVAGTTRLAGGAPTPEMEATQARLQAFTDRISREHEAGELRHVQQTRRHLRTTIGFNIAFVVLSTLFLVGSHRYFRQAIALPLRRLAERSSEIARGHRALPLPVTSTDEIGRLSDAFNRMADQLREHEERLRGLVILEERERLARELHDSLAQDLAFLRLELIGAQRSLAPDSAPAVRDRLREMLTIVDGAYDGLREAIFGLHALDVEARGGLLPALREYVRDFSEHRKIPLDLEVAPPGTLRLTPQAETQLIRIIHEALTNIVRHARASKGVVRMAEADGRARISIEDDGVGFAPGAPGSAGRHFGLQAMADRAAAVGGRLTVESAPGKGTRVIVELPLAGG
jgi:signal transduction histidine kinase